MRTLAKKEISLAKSLALVVNPSKQSFIQIKNNDDPRIDPCGSTSVSRLDNDNSHLTI